MPTQFCSCYSKEPRTHSVVAKDFSNKTCIAYRYIIN